MKSEISNDQIIKNLTKKGKLGSTILVSTNVFFELVLKQPCIICNDTNSSNQKIKIKTNGLGVCITKVCKLCSNETEYCNERSRENFSKCLAGTGLIGGVNREELRSMLALLGITRQN